MSATPASDPDDANDLRGLHFHKLIRKWTTWACIAGGALLCAVIGLVVWGAIVGAVFLVVAVPVGVFVTWRVADSQAAGDFFRVYAGRRGMELGGKTSLPTSTPLLRRGNRRYASRTLTGRLAPGVDGRLALYTSVDESADGRGNPKVELHLFTLGMTEVPESARYVPELYCESKFGLGGLDGGSRHSMEQVELESAALDEKYEVFCRKDQDANWLRQLFSPTFIVWLTDSAPSGFAFELVDGTLVAYVQYYKEDTADLDGIAAATGAVATRLREESTE
ncbi:MAG TPA: hypothetical protein VMH33_12225 [Solirubrobacterales bacterium]|nr:hypothetical protein [Solirubrobacterales bacterium]